MERPRESVVPEPLAFDPARSDAPRLPASSDGSPGVVLLVVASAAREHEWAERAAAALAAGWADQGRRILLADFALARPGLHRVLQVGNGEGVSDAFLFGSSVQRTARPVRDGRFLFMPAGTATARPQDVTSSPRWASIVEACASVRATLVAFLPSDLPGGEALLNWASDVLLLTDPTAVRHEALARGLGPRLRGILVPPDGRTEPDEQPVTAMPVAAAAVVAPPPPPLAPVVEAAPPETEEWSAPLPLMSAEETTELAADAVGIAGGTVADADDFGEASAPLPMFDVEPGPAPDVDAELTEEPTALPFLSDEPATDEIQDDAMPLPMFDVGGETEDEGFDDATPLPMLDIAPTEPDEPPDPWAEAEFTHERSGSNTAVADSGELDGFAIDLDTVPTEGDAEHAPQAVDQGAGLGDFADLPSAADPLMPEPVTAEQEQAAATVFDLSSFDGMLEEAPAPAAAAPVILESEDEPIVLGDTPPPPRPTRSHVADEEPASFDLAGAVEAPPPAAPPARPTRPSAGAAGEGASRPARPATVPRPTTPRPRPVTPPAKSRTGLLLGLLGASVALALALAWFGLIEIPVLSDWIAARRGEAAASIPAAPLAQGDRESTPAVLGTSLLLGSFTALPVARLQAESLSRQRPDLLFVVAPLDVAGFVYYRLLAGPAHDSAEAVALRPRLATLLTSEDPASWRLLSSRLAFDLGQSDDLAAARARVESLSRLDIPAYVLELPPPEGPLREAPAEARADALVQVSSRAGEPRYRVYAGAYADAHEAAYLADLLARQGETQARLIERTGRHIE